MTQHKWLCLLAVPLMALMPGARAQVPAGPVVDLDPAGTTVHSNVSVSLNGQKVVYTYADGTLNGSASGTNLMVVNADGTNRQRVRFSFVSDPASGNDLSDTFDEDSGALSPDGTKVVFQAKTRDGLSTDLVMVDLVSGAATRLTDTPENEESPTWSADGTMIAFRAPKGTLTYQAFVMKAAPESGSNVRVPLTFFTDGDVANLSGAPDGRILFDKGGEIWSVDAKDTDGDGIGDNLVQITFLGAGISQPSQAVAGGRIFFMAPHARNGWPMAYSVAPDGTGPRQVLGELAWGTSVYAGGNVVTLTAENPDVTLGSPSLFLAPTTMTDANGTVTGKLLTSGGQPQAGAAVTAYNGPDQVGAATTGADGSYTISVPAGGTTLEFVTDNPASGTVQVFVTVPAGATVTRHATTTPDGAPTPTNVVPTIKYPEGGNPWVSVFWSAAPGGTATGYNVYRAASENGPWTKLTATPIPATAPLKYSDMSPGDLATSFYTVTAVHDTLESAFAPVAQAANNILFNGSFEAVWGDTTPQGWTLNNWYGSTDGTWGTETTDKVEGDRSAFLQTGTNTAWGMILMMTDALHHPVVDPSKAYIWAQYIRYKDNPSTTKSYLQPGFYVGSESGYFNFYPWYSHNTSDLLGGGPGLPDTEWTLAANTRVARNYEFAALTRPNLIWETDGTLLPAQSRLYVDEIRHQVRRIGPTGTIYGRIQQMSANPMSAQVSAGGKTVWTEPYRGTFVLRDVPTGMVELKITNTGADDRTIMVPNYGGYTFTPDITYWDASGLPLKLIGQVLLPNGQPAAGATVRITNPRWPEKTTTTDATGHYFIEDVGSWDYSNIYVSLKPYGKVFINTALGLNGVAERNFTLLPPLPALEVVKTATAPTIDAVVNPAEWAASQVIPLSISSGNPAGPTVETTAYALWDDENLYVAFAAEEPNPAGIETRATGHDNSLIWSHDGATFNADDVATVWLDLTEMDPALPNWQIITNLNQADPSWADINWVPGWTLAADVAGFEFKARVDVPGKMWYTEMKIPFGGASTPVPTPGTEWVVNLQRNRHQPLPDGELNETGDTRAIFVTALTPFAKGDLNRDRLVDSTDVEIALKIAGGLETLGDRLTLGDINGDGKVNQIDAARILRKANGLDTF